MVSLRVSSAFNKNLMDDGYCRAMIVSSLTPQVLRQRVQAIGQAVRQQDGSPADKDHGSGVVSLRETTLPVDGYRDRVREADVSFGQAGLSALDIRTAHGQGLGGELKASMRVEGDLEHYRLKQSSYHGTHSFRGQFMSVLAIAFAMSRSEKVS